MGVGRQQKATWAVRGKMHSPGRPPGWQRDQVQRFWVEIAKGATSEDAAISVGVSSQPAIARSVVPYRSELPTSSIEPSADRRLCSKIQLIGGDIMGVVS